MVQSTSPCLGALLPSQLGSQSKKSRAAGEAAGEHEGEHHENHGDHRKDHSLVAAGKLFKRLKAIVSPRLGQRPSPGFFARGP